MEKMADRYASFAALAAGEKAGTHYRVICEDRKTPIVIIAPHGGWIEPGTSEIARAIAAEGLSFYLFEGLIAGRPHGDLHIRSHLFDEPAALALVRSAETAIAIHGRANTLGDATVWLGGRNKSQRDAIGSSLRQAGFNVGPASNGLAGEDQSNICNQGSSGAGVQLELPRSLRDELKQDPIRMKAFSDAVRRAL
jgi:phage replication-related protein YjqB (UPF0714/DUF867 family)